MTQDPVARLQNAAAELAAHITPPSFEQVIHRRGAIARRSRLATTGLVLCVLVVAGGLFAGLNRAFKGGGSAKDSTGATLRATTIKGATVLSSGSGYTGNVPVTITDASATRGYQVTGMSCAGLDADGNVLFWFRSRMVHAYVPPGGTSRIVPNVPFRTGVSTRPVSFRCHVLRARPWAPPSPHPSSSAPAPNVIAPGFQPVSIGFWNDQQGVMVGTVHCPGCEGSTPGGLIATTDDGGHSWQRVRTALPPAGRVSVVAGGLGYMTAGPDLLFTQDYGATWARVTSRSVIDPSFSSSSDGWATAPDNQTSLPLHPATLLRTIDGGHSWSTVLGPCPRLAPSIVGVSFPTPAIGWVLCEGEGGVGSMWKGVYRTDDGGQTWSLAYGGGLSYGYPSDVSFLADGHGWLLFDFRGQVLQTVDGGAHWTPNHVARAEESSLVSVSFLSDSDGFGLWSGSGGMKLIRTTDGGHSWTTVLTIQKPR